MTTLLFGGNKIVETAPVIGPVYNATPLKDIVAELQILEMPRTKRDAARTNDLFILVALCMIGFLWFTS